MKNEPNIQVEGTETRAAVELTAGLNFTLNIKNTRSAVIEAVKNSRSIPLVHQETILAEIAAMNEKHELLQLTVIRHPHKGGGNLTFTVCEI